MFFSCNAIDPFFFEAVIFSLQSWGHSHKKLLLQYDLWMGDGIFLLWFKYRVSHYTCDIYYWMFILLLFKTSKCTEWVIMYVTYTNNKLIFLYTTVFVINSDIPCIMYKMTERTKYHLTKQHFRNTKLL